MKHQIAFLLMLLLTIATGCSANHRILQAEPQMINSDGLAIACSPPIRRTKAIGTLRFEIMEEWHRTKNPGLVRLANDKEVGFTVELIDSEGRKYVTKDLHPNGDTGVLYLAAHIRTTPTSKESFHTVVIKSTEPIQCRRVEWIDWNPE